MTLVYDGPLGRAWTNCEPGLPLLVLNFKRLAAWLSFTDEQRARLDCRIVGSLEHTGFAAGQNGRRSR